MDLFTLVTVLIMGGATLCGFALLLSLIVMERKAICSGSDADRTHRCPRARDRTAVRGAAPRPVAGRRPRLGAAMPPSARRLAARRRNENGG